MATGCPMMKMKAQTDHPCFGGDHSKAGRIHLPVAPGCNIKCGFCERKFDCANESRPGVTSRVLTPEQAVERVRLVQRHMEKQGGAKLKVVGIAGPGDPLANPKTFETFKRVREAFPEMTLCLSTNGLRLPEMVETIVEHDVHSLTITINALTPETGAKVYEWIKVSGHKLEGEEAAAILIDQQLKGLKLAAAAGMLVKINHVYIPGVNDHETLELAVKVRELGASMMNIMPVIPVGLFKDIDPPSEATMEMVRNQAELILSQARHCKQCRADAAGVVGQDIDLAALEAKAG
ncbi:nitrogenase molybdenum-iron cofactor biosynthesis radical SAM domain iron-sulfur cluster-binding oxidoreductase [Desulfuromonas versatilis]|uniref:FeMo cofactor biosynthesis protein NifB n=1 Tax=Desulfuromonas versatilis TaxID=2802975 RepID=A0ABN6E2I7_9BACT|nr:radical SAM protein [Desulfuromonas versatilis]BCR06538.1 nitrogenase molybdenum-iron cofactor biosynthesis radical SAM domain iron-sulfur cluster-binding oxidoreductase [Desulfuromonas versatilis]